MRALKSKLFLWGLSWHCYWSQSFPSFYPWIHCPMHPFLFLLFSSPNLFQGIVQIMLKLNDFHLLWSKHLEFVDIVSILSTVAKDSNLSYFFVGHGLESWSEWGNYFLVKETSPLLIICNLMRFCYSLIIFVHADFWIWNLESLRFLAYVSGLSQGSTIPKVWII